MKRRITLSILLIFGIFAFTACGGANNESNQRTEVKSEEKENNNDDKNASIELLVPGYDSGYLKDELDECIEKYTAENKNVEVKILPVGWDELNSKVVQLYQAGEAPDIMLLGSRSIRQFAELGALEDLESYMSPEFLETRVENLMDTAAVDGKQYGIPMAFSSRALFYRPDLIDTPPTNWDELLETAKKVSEEEGIKGFAIPTDATSGTDEILNFFYQGGGRMVDEEGNITLDTAENIESLEYLQKFKDYIPDVVSTERADQAQMFVNGDLAMFISGSWEIPDLEEGDYEFKTAKLPKGKEESVNLVTDSYVMSSISENKEAAWDFIEFMSEPDQQFKITDAYDWYPVTKAEEEREQYKEELIRPFIDIIPSGEPEPQVANWDEFDKSFRIAVQKAITGESTAEEALKKAQEELSK